MTEKSFMRTGMGSGVKVGDTVTMTGKLRNPRWRWWKPWQPKYIATCPMRVVSVSANMIKVSDDADNGTE